MHNKNVGKAYITVSILTKVFAYESIDMVTLKTLQNYKMFKKLLIMTMKLKMLL